MNSEFDKQIQAKSRESELLKRRAWRLGIEVPIEWYVNDSELHFDNGVPPDQLEYVTRFFLSEEGSERLKFLIQQAEEKREDAALSVVKND